MKTDLFQSCDHCWVFQMCWHTECSTFTASSLRTWNSSAGIPSLLAFFVVMLPKAHLISDYRMSGCSPNNSFFLQFSSVAQLHPTLCHHKNCSTPGLPVHHQLPEFTQTHFHWVGDAIQPSHPLSSPSLPTFNLSRIRVFSNESTLRKRWPKYWSFSFNISPSNEHPGLISFRVDWLDLLAV